MIKRIITHPGKAHRDDFLAVCIALSNYGVVPVERREPTLAELADPGVMILDIGEDHHPGVSNFDHHQLDAGVEECALSLLLKHRGLLQKFRETFNWFETTVLLDSNGPVAVQRKLDVSKDSMLALWSPIESGVLRLFEEGLLHPLEMARIGDNLIQYMNTVAYQVESLRDGIGEYVEVDGVSGVIVKDGQVFEPKAIELYRQYLEKKHEKEIAFSISKDDRGAGFALYRFDDNRRIDFTKLEGHQHANFVHKKGFLVKTAFVPRCELLAMVRRSIGPCSREEISR